MLIRSDDGLVCEVIGHPQHSYVTRHVHFLTPLHRSLIHTHHSACPGHSHHNCYWDLGAPAGDIPSDGGGPSFDGGGSSDGGYGGAGSSGGYGGAGDDNGGSNLPLVNAGSNLPLVYASPFPPTAINTIIGPPREAYRHIWARARSRIANSGFNDDRLFRWIYGYGNTPSRKA